MFLLFGFMFALGMYTLIFLLIVNDTQFLVCVSKKNIGSCNINLYHYLLDLYSELLMTAILYHMLRK
jgi:hypothetical protein